MVIENQSLRISTGVVNEIVTEAVALQQPPSDKGKRAQNFLYNAGRCEAADVCGICQ